VLYPSDSNRWGNLPPDYLPENIFLPIVLDRRIYPAFIRLAQLFGLCNCNPDEKPDPVRFSCFQADVSAIAEYCPNSDKYRHRIIFLFAAAANNAIGPEYEHDPLSSPFLAVGIASSWVFGRSMRYDRRLFRGLYGSSQ